MADGADGASTELEPLEAVPLVGEAATGEAAPQWAQYTDESGASYYASVATGETSWTLPEHAQVLVLHEHSTPRLDAVDHSDAKGFMECLAPEVQLQMEAARRRLGSLDPAESHWVEMFDPTQDALYYYALYSGEISWARPADAEVLRFDQDPITNTIVRIQCAIRVQLAHRRVFNRKQSLANLTTLIDHVEDERPVAVNAAPLVWVEVYDPVQQLLYYHCSATGETRWDPPRVFVTANESKEVAAAVSIQSLARGRYARGQVERKRVEKTARDELRQRQRAYMGRPEAEREADCRRELLKQENDQVQRGDQFWGVEVHDREVRRQLVEEAMLASAELFWRRVNAARRQQRGRSVDWRSVKLEEETRKLRERQAELAERETMEREEQLQCQDGDGFWGIQADERREGMARRAMEDEDTTSRFFSDELNDAERCAFWAEEASSNALRGEKRRVMQEKRNQAKYLRWFYHQCSSVDDLLDYLWPTQQRFTPSPVTAVSTTTASPCAVAGSPVRQPTRTDKATNRSFYKLDDLVVRERMESGDLMFGHRPLLTIHHPNAAQIEARRGRFDVRSVSTAGVFDKAALAPKKPINTSPYRPPPPLREERSEPKIRHQQQQQQQQQQQVDSDKAPAVRYRRSRTPDPHIPARFNGVPFMPSQISPTRDILCGDHRKLTQLPSLPAAGQASRLKLTKKPRESSSPTRGRSPSPKAAVKKKPAAGNQKSPGRRRHMSIFDHEHEMVDPMATSYGFVSPFAAERRRFSEQQRLKQQQRRRDADGTSNSEGDGDRESMSNVERQFDRAERGTLAQVFAWMDVDGSGTVNRKEMAWALAHDHEVLALAKQSALLRLLLKDRSHLDELFTQLDAAAVASSTNNKSQGKSVGSTELSWDLFILFCREMYARLTDQGLLPLLAVGGEPGKGTSDDAAASRGLPSPQEKPSISLEDSNEAEEHTIRRVFQLLDADGNGILERREICAALFESASGEDNSSIDHTIDSELSALISASRALQPLLHQSLLMKAFTSFESADPDGICEEEFVAFCLEIAEVAAVNHMS